MSRISKYASPLLQENQWKTGAYIRLSREDENLSNKNSQSVIAQKLIIEKYFGDHPELELIDYFIDDGYTGTDMNRPAFASLRYFFENGKINCIIVKDLSRLARNDYEANKLVRIIFPFYRIRFISINDHIDSFENPESINRLDVSFKNIMNDEYSRDLSKKVKTALLARERRGEFLGAFAPYGYIKDPKDKHKLLIDYEAAETVKLIFEQFSKGANFSQIARLLTDKNIPSPFLYKKTAGSKLQCNFQSNEIVWNSTTVKKILTSEVYMGNLVQAQSGAISYKNHKRIPKPKDEWVTAFGTHEAIIDKETFARVQSIIKNNYRQKRNKAVPGIFSRVLICGNCGCKMSITGFRQGNKNRSYYCSSNYKRNRRCISKFHIRESIIYETVLVILNKYLKIFMDYNKKKNEIIEKIKNANIEKNNNLILNSSIEKAKKFRSDLYTQYKQGLIDFETYKIERKKSENKIEKLKKCLEMQVSSDVSETNSKIKVIKVLGENTNFTKLDRNIVESFIESIRVYSNERIEVKFKFHDELKELAEFIRQNT